MRYMLAYIYINIVYIKNAATKKLLNQLKPKEFSDKDDLKHDASHYKYII